MGKKEYWKKFGYSQKIILKSVIQKWKFITYGWYYKDFFIDILNKCHCSNEHTYTSNLFPAYIFELLLYKIFMIVIFMDVFHLNPFQ